MYARVTTIHGQSGKKEEGVRIFESTAPQLKGVKGFDGGASDMRTLRIVGVVAALAVVLFASILVFMTFDHYAHRGSETVPTFIIVMGPIWAGALGGAWAWLHPAEPHQNGPMRPRRRYD
jgi:hypothetical protein